jgi:CRISPR-associated protein Cmr3
MNIKVDAFDTLFFRDGKPFSFGAETWADAVFPPAPSVIYGALRGKYFGEHIDKLNQAETDDDPTKKGEQPQRPGLILKTVALQNENSLLFPLPLDCVQEKDSQERHVFVLRYQQKIPMSNCPVATVFVPEKNRIVEHKPGLLKDNAFQEYLCGQTENLSYDKLSEYMVSEPKIGIGRENSSHVSQDGMLYRMDMHRLASRMTFGKTPQTLSLFVEFEGIDLPAEGILRLGGEGKAAHYTLSDATIAAPPQLNGNQFKIYFASPAIFEKGWLPEWINAKTLEGNYGNLKVRLETAIIGKPIVIGGFDMKQKAPKTMRRAVPAGSVYYFTLIAGTPQEAVDTFHHRCISDYDPQQGFGLTFVGV